MKIPIGEKYLILKRSRGMWKMRKGLERGPFGCWNLYCRWFRIGWELQRWH